MTWKIYGIMLLHVPEHLAKAFLKMPQEFRYPQQIHLLHSQVLPQVCLPHFQL
jgi:hypothetical protein